MGLGDYLCEHYSVDGWWDFYVPQTFTYDELSKEVDEEWESLYKDFSKPKESCSFKALVLGLIKPGKSVEIDETNQEYKIIE